MRSPVSCLCASRRSWGNCNSIAGSRRPHQHLEHVFAQPCHPLKQIGTPRTARLRVIEAPRFFDRAYGLLGASQASTSFLQGLLERSLQSSTTDASAGGNVHRDFEAETKIARCGGLPVHGSTPDIQQSELGPPAAGSTGPAGCSSIAISGWRCTS